MDWTQVKNFKKEEWREDPEEVNPKLIMLVDSLTSEVKRRYGASAGCIIHVAYESEGHEPDSRHYYGVAVDLHFEEVDLIDQYLLAERFAFTGIGVYPYWRNPGLHLEIEDLAPGAAGKRWWRDICGECDECDKGNLPGCLSPEYKALDRECIELLLGVS